MSLVEWPLTFAVKMLDTHNFAQVSQINECLLRSTSRYEYAVFTNLDEFIVPRSLEFHNWNLLYENYFTKQNSAAYYFTNVFFKTEWPDDPIYSQHKTIKSLQSRILLKTNRDESLNLEGKGTRTKMIVNGWTFRRSRTSQATRDNPVLQCRSQSVCCITIASRLSHRTRTTSETLLCLTTLQMNSFLVFLLFMSTFRNALRNLYLL